MLLLVSSPIQPKHFDRTGLGREHGCHCANKAEGDLGKGEGRPYIEGQLKMDNLLPCLNPNSASGYSLTPIL